MRVLVVSTVYPSSTAPTFGVFVEERIRRMAGHCEVVVVAPVPWFPFNRWIRGRGWASTPLVERRHGITIHHPRFFSVPRFGKCLDGALCFLSVLPLVRRLRREFAFDWVDGHFVYPDGLAAALLARTFGTPVSITLRGDELRVIQFALRRPQMRFALRGARVIAVSQSLVPVAERLGVPPAAVRVIPNGVDTECFRRSDRESARRRLGLPENRTILLAVGSLIERKGHHRVLALLPELVRRRPELLYVAVGGAVPGDPHAKMLQDLVRSEGLEGHVRFVPPQPHEEIAAWLSAADLFCLATRSEGWCNALTEALACGCPVVTTRVGGNAEQMRDGEDGLLVPYWQPAEFAAAVERALEKGWDREAIARRARRRSWDQVAADVLEAFRAPAMDAAPLTARVGEPGAR
jgi:glycosyltransferase involved in cell wall biosynthesis